MRAIPRRVPTYVEVRMYGGMHYFIPCNRTLSFGEGRVRCDGGRVRSEFPQHLVVQHTDQKRIHDPRAHERHKR